MLCNSHLLRVLYFVTPLQILTGRPNKMLNRGNYQVERNDLKLVCSFKEKPNVICKFEIWIHCYETDVFFVFLPVGKEKKKQCSNL